MKIWHCFIGQRPSSAIFEALSQTNLPLLACEAPTATGPGIVFFDEITNQLLELLRTASRRGLERVLAVALKRSDLKTTAAWRLLELLLWLKSMG
jgi:hypothetical protein